MAGADAMRILSVNVAIPREVPWNGGTLLTGIFKEPRAGRVALRRLNLDGDRQADLTVHGGPSKAVYAYPGEHYALWEQELGIAALPFGMFGENLTTHGLIEQGVHIGDRLRAGEVELVVTEPRLPCFKLGIKFGRTDIIKRFAESGRSGFYLAVAQEGKIGAGDALEFVSRDPAHVSIADILRLHAERTPDRELLQRALGVEALPSGWRNRFQQKLAKLEA